MPQSNPGDGMAGQAIRVFMAEHLDRGMIDRIQFRLVLEKPWAGQTFLASAAHSIGRQLWDRHKDHALFNGRNRANSWFPFDRTARWSRPSPLAPTEIGLRGLRGGPLWHFALRGRLNGIHLAKTWMIDHGLYDPGDEPTQEKQRNFIAFERARISPDEISRLSFRLVVDAIRGEVDEFVALACTARGGGEIPVSAVKLIIDSVEVAVDRSIHECDLPDEHDARSLLDRLDTVWTLVTGGRYQPGEDFPELFRSWGNRAIHVYPKGVRWPILRSESVVKGEGAAGLRFRIASVTPEEFRTRLLDAVRPLYERVVSVSKAAQEPVDTDMVGAIAAISTAIGRPRCDARSLRWVLECLVRDGRVRHQTEPERLAAKALRDGGVAIWDAREGCTRPAGPLIGSMRTILAAEQALRRATDVVPPGLDTGRGAEGTAMAQVA